MTAIYHKVDTQFIAEFLYFTTAAVTGKVAGDFTIQVSKDGTGNQATTGITIAEIDATNNAGGYSVTFNPTTSIVANTGFYHVEIFDTAAPSYRWTLDLYVTESGTGAGTTGSAFFQAAINDGRITDGTNALEGADVYVQRASDSVLLAKLTTDASGLYSFYSSATVDLVVQKSGYTQGTGTVTVVGSTATGPGADIALTSTASSGSLTAGELWAYALRQMRDRSGNRADTEKKQVVNEALLKIAKDNLWEYYLTDAELVLNGSYNTGTVAVTNGSATVTLTGGTFPTWAASGEIVISGRRLQISTRDSATQLTLDNAWEQDTDSAATYLLWQDSYTLPSDIMRFGEFFPDRAWPFGDQATSYLDIVRAKNDATYSESPGRLWSMHNSKFIIWPPPSDDTVLPYVYYRRPAFPAVSADTIDWDGTHRDLLFRAIDYFVCIRCGETQGGLTIGQHLDAYRIALVEAQSNERTTIRRSSPMARRNRPFGRNHPRTT